MVHFSCQGQTVQQKDEIVADGIGQESVTETPVVETPPQGGEAQQGQVPENSQQGQESDGHPAWKPLRDELGDVLFHKIKPHLSEFDSQAQKRITELNSKYDAWKGFEAEGVNPDVVKRALGIVQGIDANPLQMYQALENHLRSQGLLQEPVAQEQPSVEGDEEPEDPRDQALRELQEQQEQMRLFLETQEQQARQAEYDRQADQALESEINALRQARPGTTPQEEASFLKNLALHMRAGNLDMTLEKVAAEYDAERNRILSQPRPNDFAPRIPGAGGGAPTGAPQQKRPEDFTREESQAYFADLLTRGK